MAEALPEYPDSDFSEDDQSPLEVSFNKASDHVRKITTKLNNNQLLELYGLYKQSTEGKCNIPRPGWLDGKGRKKWEAWRSLVDMPSDEAKQKYIDLVQKYDPECELVEEAGPKQQWVAVSSLQRAAEPDLSHDEFSLLDAARENMGELVSKLISNNPAIKGQRDKDGLTALHWAADRNATSALEAAIQSGCDINAVDNSGQTALHYAASCGHVNSTQILINAGAKQFKDEDDCSPLDLAADEEIRNILCA
ncbi:acyl-CoA-binding domain-containing protein 6 [Pieris rapae]|uniref:acyl-CoA-binding domain-containing protein 6 n=1 Tax=Pieris rapae TaxID=64459 RepID=UPI001E27F652|nr:acyl-CoA-binding domain-containing protein 6 [Pieris rapae]